MQGLGFVGDNAGLDQLHDTVGEHFGVDAQVVLLLQEQQHGVGDGADAQLKRIAVPHQAGDVLANGPLHVADLGGCQLDDGGVGLHQAADLGDVQEAVAQGAGHVLIDLGDDQVGGLGSGLGVVHGNAQAHIAVRIGGRALEQGHVGPQVLPQEAGNFGKIHRGEIHAALGGGGAGGAAQEEGVVVEVFVILGLAVGCLAHGDHVDDLHVFILGGVGDQGVQDDGRLAAGVGDHHPLAGLDLLHGLRRSEEMLFVPGFPSHPNDLLLVLSVLFCGLFGGGCRLTIQAIFVPKKRKTKKFAEFPRKKLVCPVAFPEISWKTGKSKRRTVSFSKKWGTLGGTFG